VNSFNPLRQLAKNAQELIKDQFAILLHISDEPRSGDLPTPAPETLRDLNKSKREVTLLKICANPYIIAYTLITWLLLAATFVYKNWYGLGYFSDLS
jgi:hypothetical protein